MLSFIDRGVDVDNNDAGSDQIHDGGVRADLPRACSARIPHGLGRARRHGEGDLAMTPQKEPAAAFEVVSIRRSVPLTGGNRGGADPAGPLPALR